MFRVTEGKKSFIVHGRLGDTITINKNGGIKCHLNNSYSEDELRVLFGKVETLNSVASDVHRFRLWKKSGIYYCVLGPAGSVVAECRNAKRWGKYGFLCVAIDGVVTGHEVRERGVNLYMSAVREYYLVVDQLDSGKELWSTGAEVDFLCINGGIIARWMYKE